MKTINYNNKLYIQDTNDCYVVESSNDLESGDLMMTISTVDAMPTNGNEIPTNDVYVSSMMENLMSCIENLATKLQA